MNLEKRKNPFGGSAGGGGYDYQAEAYALVAAKILAEESLNWLETGWDRVPVSVRVETGRGGDDLRITLRSGVMIELQAKRGLKEATTYGMQCWISPKWSARPLSFMEFSSRPRMRAARSACI